MSEAQLESKILAKIKQNFTISRRRVKKYAPQESKGDKIIIIPFSRIVVINPGTAYEQARRFGSMPEIENDLNQYRKLYMAKLLENVCS